MHLEKIHLERIRKFINRIKQDIYTDKHDLQAQFCYSQENPILPEDINKQTWNEVKKAMFGVEPGGLPGSASLP